ncbi:hypothetical protein [Amycolatopsis sp. NPDC004079]|uniref:hypothetical protein n=1 Tax=Amycolatopsis sp. NPDC004079 TaxID=3154549 RepID=UPI0033A7A4CB
MAMRVSASSAPEERVIAAALSPGVGRRAMKENVMSAVASVAPAAVQPGSDEQAPAAEVAEVYGLMLVDLAVTIEKSRERSTVPGVAIARDLRKLAAGLRDLAADVDERLVSKPGPAPVLLVRCVDELLAYVDGCTFGAPAFRSVPGLVGELREVLVGLAAVAPAAKEER